jgi:arylsulfatase A-like enzyme
MQQQYFNVQLSEERRRLKKKVNESEELYHAKVDEDDWKKQEKDHRQEQGAAERGIEGKASGEPNQPDHIDIKV